MIKIESTGDPRITARSEPLSDGSLVYSVMFRDPPGYLLGFRFDCRTEADAWELAETMAETITEWNKA